MKVLMKLAILFIFLPAARLVMAQDTGHMAGQDSTTHTMLNTDAFKWMPAPEGLPKGAKVAILSGNPGEAGPFTLRVTFPANYQIKPHWHPTAENLTVIQGQIFMGTSETFSQTNGTGLQTGGFVSMPAKTVHYLYTKAPATIQVNAVGPFAITYVNKADDPRGQAQK